MSSRNMCLLPRATLHSDSEHQLPHIEAKAELGGGGWKGVPTGPKMALLLYYVFTAILSLIEHVKTFNDRYLLKESFYLTILLYNPYFKVANRT